MKATTKKLPAKRWSTKSVTVIPPRKNAGATLDEIRRLSDGGVNLSTGSVTDLLELRFQLESLAEAVGEVLRRQTNIIVQKTRGY